MKKLCPACGGTFNSAPFFLSTVRAGGFAPPAYFSRQNGAKMPVPFTPHRSLGGPPVGLCQLGVDSFHSSRQVSKPDHPVFSPLLTATLMGLGSLFTTQGGRPGADHSAGGGMSSPRLKAGVVGLADRQGKSGTPGLWPGLIFIGGALFQTPTTPQL